MEIDQVMEDTRKELKQYPEARVYLSKPPVILGLGTAGGFEMQVEARNGATFENLVEAVDTLMKYAAESKAFTGLSSSLQVRNSSADILMSTGTKPNSWVSRCPIFFRR